MDLTEVDRNTRLPDLCADALAFAVQLRRAREPGVDALRADVKKLFTAIDQGAQAAGKDTTLVAAARYALAAFLDEVVLTSNWSIRQEWASRPLQMEYFNDFTAGEEFYRKLDNLRGSRDAARQEAVEVYALCLGLGFRGKHAGMAGSEELKGLRARLHAELAGPDAVAQPLSPHWQVDEHLPQIARRIPAWLIASVCAGVLLLVVLVLRLTLSGAESALLEAR
ncbi:MAG: DotU family type IV/VI secretion system protein [Planctomycetes bacterium]|nr:DotU family type IV/VI secretion system protein [Planctomycetota bacterium]